MYKTIRTRSVSILCAALCAAWIVSIVLPWSRTRAQTADPTADSAATMLAQGKQTFRFDTFGDEAFWGDALKLHQAIAGSRLGGVGPGVSPKTALAVGLKVDVDAVPPDLAAQISAGAVNLDDPATT